VERDCAYSCDLTLLGRAELATVEVLAYVLDGLGGVRLLVDRDTYQVVDTYRYAPFGNLLAGGAGEALTQVGLYGKVRNPQLVGAAMLSGVASGGVLGAVGHGLSERNTLWRVLRQKQIKDGSIARGAFRPDRLGQVSVFRGPGWLVKPLVRRSPAFRDIGGFARLSRSAIQEAGLRVVAERDPGLGRLLGSLHENVLYPAHQMSKGVFDRLLFGLVQSLE